MNSIIVSYKEDGHVAAVMWALKQTGHNCTLIDSTYLWHLQLDDVGMHTGGASSRLAFPLVQKSGVSIWNRRLKTNKNLDGIAPDYRKHVSIEGREFETNLLHWLEHSPNVFSVNPLSRLRTAEIKSVQLDVAVRSGLRVPETLISASPTLVRDFAARHGSLVVKPFYPHYWQDNTKLKSWASFANVTTAEHLNSLRDQDIRISPSIYQAYVPTVSDIRVAVIGDRIHCLEMRHRKKGDIDFRTMPDEALSYGEIRIPEEVGRALLKIMETLGINLAAADFVIDADGTWWFLELNPSGSFLFIEEKCPEIRVLSSIGSLLAFGKVVDNADELFPRLSEFFESTEGADWKDNFNVVKQDGSERPSLTMLSA